MLSSFGIQVERFDIRLPKRTGVQVSLEKIVDGKPPATLSRYTLYVDQGLQKLLLLKKEHEDKTVEFSFQGQGQTIKLGQASHEGYSTAFGSIDIKMLTPDKQPILIFAAKKGYEIKAFSNNPGDVMALATDYDFLLVVYISAEIE